MARPRRARESELTQLAPQRHRVLAAGREPRLEMLEVGIQNAATECPGGTLREALGLRKLPHRPACQPHATADGEQRLAGGMPAPNLIVERFPARPAVSAGRPLGAGAREGAGATRLPRPPTRDRWQSAVH